MSFVLLISYGSLVGFICAISDVGVIGALSDRTSCPVSERTSCVALPVS